MANIVSIYVQSTYESCERTTFYVTLKTDEGFTMTPSGHRTGSIYTNGEGLSIEEARDRALIDAANWADFLQLEVEPFVDADGNAVTPSLTFESYRIQREMKAPQTSDVA